MRYFLPAQTQYQTPLPFKVLFNTYRLRAGFETLRQLADELAGAGIVYEESVFSRWKNGSRIPRKRIVLLALIKLFIQRGALRSVYEANLILSATGLCGLRTHEIQALFYI